MSYIALNLRPFDVNIDTSSVTNYTYTNLDDSLATITAPGYFSTTLEDSANIATSVKLNDLIYVHGSDGSDQLKVTSLNPITLNTQITPSGDFFVDNVSFLPIDLFTHFYQINTNATFVRIFGTITEDITVDPIDINCRDNALNNILTATLPATLVKGDQYAIEFDADNAFVTGDILRLDLSNKAGGTGAATMQMLYTRT